MPSASTRGAFVRRGAFSPLCEDDLGDTGFPPPPFPRRATTPRDENWSTSLARLPPSVIWEELSLRVLGPPRFCRNPLCGNGLPSFFAMCFSLGLGRLLPSSRFSSCLLSFFLSFFAANEVCYCYLVFSFLVVLSGNLQRCRLIRCRARIWRGERMYRSLERSRLGCGVGRGWAVQGGGEERRLALLMHTLRRGL